MLVSMTGFSSKTMMVGRSMGAPFEITLMLKSLNARFFEATCRIPHALTHLETEIIKRLKAKLVRGTVYATLQVSNPNSLKAKLVPAFNIVEGYIDALNAIQQRFAITGSLTVSDLVGLPHVWEFGELSVGQEVTNEILACVDNLADELLTCRIAEGAQLEKDILCRLHIITDILALLEEKVAIALQERKDGMYVQIAALFQELPSELRDHQLQLMQMQLAKNELNEEVVRFAAHLANMKEFINTPILEKGKRLDFITQELFREANTIGSKASNAEIGNLAISIKVELEKIREQVQNVL